MKNRNTYEKVDNWIAEFLFLSFEQAKQIASFRRRAEASIFEAEFSHFLDVILPGRSENLFTLRLLCEAWQIVNDRGECECNGIPIQAPSKLAEWLAPFGTDATADDIAAQMGEAKGAATVLFQAIQRPQGSNLNDAVSAYLSASASKQ